MKKMNPFLRQVILLLLVLLAIPTATVWAQEMNKKYALTTLMFLDELKEQEELAVKGPRRAPVNQLPDEMMIKKPRRFIASPDTIGGVAYISCFIHLKDVGNLNDVRSLGVEVEETFDRQHFVTARVPVRQLEALADIDNVIQIKVAQLMQPMTDVAREKTHVDDLLTQSDDAIAAGINKKYDGTGVVLGIIDTGIDFQHIAFKDKNGNSRIKRAYVYGSTGTEYKETEITSTMPTTDDVTMDHGTHTASTAGGSSVIVNGSTVTVTDNHASATYGGIAPGADLYLAGVKGLSDTGLTNALQKMVHYADSLDKPLVVSNSWGSRNGPHDGTGQWADLVHEYFGDSHPNRIIIFSSANDAGHSINGEGGGFFVKKSSASSSSPLGTIIRSAYYTNTDGGYRYQGLVSYASSSSPLNCKIYVLDNLTGQVLTDWTLTTNTKSFSGLDTYYSGTMSVNMAQNSYTGKYELSVKANELETKQRLGSVEHFTSRYTLAIEVYPASDSADINMWGGHNSYYANILETPDHTWLAGTDDMCVSDEATIPDAISVGAYVSKTQVKNYEGNDYAYNSGALGDIADFSSYATASQSTTGKAYPWITAPGAQLVAGVNHYHTKDVDNTSYFGDDRKSRLVVNSDTDPYASMQGTSMSTPVAAGIVALWLQAAKEKNKNLTVNDVKEIMEQTAIQDEFTMVNSRFGKGKIDALAGIQYILNNVQPSTETLQIVTLSFSQKSAAATVGMDFTEPKLTTNPENLAVTYSSSSPSVARVNATTGEVTLLAEGTTTITAAFSGNNIYSAGLASYTLTVSEATPIENRIVLYNEGVNTSTIETANGKTKNVTLSGRTLYKDGKWNTLCLPFDVKIAGSVLEGATARPLTSASITGSTMNLTFGDAVTELTAGTPYIIKWGASGTTVIANPVFTGVTISTADNSYDNHESGVTRVRFFGNYDKRTFNSEDKSILFLGSDDKLYYPDGVATTTIGACRAYFKIGDDDTENTLPARLLTAFSLDLSDETATGIAEVQTVPAPSISRNTGWYTLDGRRLQGQPTTKGLYINNGRKMIVK